MHCDNKGIEPIYSIETNSYRTNKEIIHKKEDTKCIKIIKHYKNDSLWRCYKRKKEKIKTIEDQGRKQIETLKDLKLAKH